ncbi:MAG: hypothetical protein AAGD06_07150 [Acidobacteriota bacterium]
MPENARKFRIELGINLNATTIAHTDPTKQLYPLQNAPIRLQPHRQTSPDWWTRFEPGDELTFRLVDITNLAQPNPGEFDFEAQMTFHCTDPATGFEVQPLTEPAGVWTVDSKVESRKSPVYSPTVALPTRDIVPMYSSRGPHSVVLAACASDPFRFEFAGEVVAMINGERRCYVFDPEIIVSDARGPNR